jgi:hypothetical protein
MKVVPTDEPVPLDPAQENINVLDMLPLKAFEGQDHQSHIMAHMIFGSTPMIAAMPPMAMALQKHILEHVRIAAQEQAAVQYLQGRQQAGMQPANEQEMLEIEKLTAQLVAQGMQQLKELSGQMSGEGGPDPLVQLKEAELQQKAQEAQADNQVDMAKLQLDQTSQQTRAQQFQQRLASQEEMTRERIDSAMQRELLKQRGQGQ